MKKVEHHVVQFKDVMKQQLEEEMQSRVDDTVRKELRSQVSELDEVHETLSESKVHADIIRMERAEKEDIEARRCNIILYRVPDSNEVLATGENMTAKYVKNFLVTSTLE